MQNDIRYRYLYESFRLESMRAASEALNVATSSISRQIAELEKDLGMPLIETGRRRLKLTEAGEAAAAYYQERRALEEVFQSQLADLKSVRSGRIDLVAGEAFVTENFNLMLQQFMQQYPGLAVQVKVSGTRDAIAQIREDEAHFGLVFDPPMDPKVRPRLSFSQPLHVLVNPTHPLAKKILVEFASLPNFCVALPEDSFRIRQVVRLAEHDAGIYIEPRLVANSMTLLKGFARHGQGLTLMPTFLAQEELASGKLVAIPTDNRILGATRISLITRTARQMPMGVYCLIQRMESYLRQHATLTH